MSSPRARATVRQEKLLQGIMTEIVRMTSQMRPLEMGVPLYPFSHSGVFPATKDGGAERTGAPLPDSASYAQEDVGGSPTSIHGHGLSVGGTPPIGAMVVPMPMHAGMQQQQQMHMQQMQQQQQQGAAQVWHTRQSLSPAGRTGVSGMPAAHPHSHSHSSAYPHPH